MRRSLVLVILGSILVLPLLGGSASVAASSNRVVCVGYDQGGEARFDLRRQPRKCTFVHRNQQPFGYNTVDMIKLHWKSWGQRRARAKGKVVINMVGPTPAFVTLSQPQSGCRGKTVFTRATFRDADSGRRTRLPLDACH